MTLQRSNVDILFKLHMSNIFRCISLLFRQDRHLLWMAISIDECQWGRKLGNRFGMFTKFYRK